MTVMVWRQEGAASLRLAAAREKSGRIPECAVDPTG
jgi:hypothetical protein